MTRLGTVAIAIAVVVSMLAPFAPVGTAEAAPSGFVGVPSDSISEDVRGNYNGDLSAANLTGEVLASSNASTTEVVVVSAERAPAYQNSQSDGHSGSVIVEGDVGLVIRDDANQAGRDIAVPADVIRAK